VVGEDEPLLAGPQREDLPRVIRRALISSARRIAARSGRYGGEVSRMCSIRSRRFRDFIVAAGGRRLPDLRTLLDTSAVSPEVVVSVVASGQFPGIGMDPER
jgi:hypothetical protein